MQNFKALAQMVWPQHLFEWKSCKASLSKFWILKYWNACWNLFYYVNILKNEKNWCINRYSWPIWSFLFNFHEFKTVPTWKITKTMFLRKILSNLEIMWKPHCFSQCFEILQEKMVGYVFLDDTKQNSSIWIL